MKNTFLTSMLLISLAFTDVSLADVLLDLDASGLKTGPATDWQGQGGVLFNSIAPVNVETVQGRKAFIFDGTQQFIGSAPLSAGLEKARGFTVEAWAQNPTLEKTEVVVALAPSLGGPGTEFSFSAGPSAGAFRSGFKATTPYSEPPLANAWHHIAWSYSSEEARLRVYVDGELNVEKSLRVQLQPRPRIHIGASGEMDNKGPKKGFSGAIARIRLHDTSLTQTELRQSAGLLDAFAPVPRDHATTDSLSIRLQWERGCSEAAGYTVFMGADRDSVEHSDPKLSKTSKETSLGPVELKLGAKYFWRVAQLDKNNRIISVGKVWTFTADPGFASKPGPRDGDSNVEPGHVQLTWVPGKYESRQSIYFSTSREELERNEKPAVTGMASEAGICPMPQGLQPGTRYYWRVDSENGTQSPTHGPVWTFRTQDTPVHNDITFFVSSDSHYGRENNAAINRRVIAEMNNLPGTPLPEAVGGGYVRTPRGVVLNGDLLDEGFDTATAPANWTEFCHDYGLTGKDGLLCFPLYEGFGNHDGGPAKSFVRAGIKERNARRVALNEVSSNGLHYSWEWDDLHLVQLNLFGGSGASDVKGVNGPEHDPEASLDFLQADLSKNLGTSGRPLIAFQHFAWIGGMSDWWHMEAKDRFYEAVKSYNVVCLINGHSHGASFLPWKELLTIHDGSTARGESDNGDFLVVRVTEKELIVIQRKIGGWGIHHRRPLKAKTPEGSR